MKSIQKICLSICITIIVTTNIPVFVEASKNNNVVQTLRGTWISSVYNIDWPKTSFKENFDAQKQKQAYINMLNKLQYAGINAVFVQVRPTSDALYPSKLLPWSKWLTGVQGKDPGYDPLAFMIEETHKRGMKFHAWFNPFRVHVNDDLSQLVADHPAKKHPQWVVKHAGMLIYNPGLPEVRAFIVHSIMEVVHRYPIDGVHLDDYFYPTNEKASVFADEDTYKDYNDKFKNKGDWRRNNINEFVKALHKQLKFVNPEIKFGISPLGIWRNSHIDRKGSPTKGLSSYDNAYADTIKWIDERWIDYVVPQIYWHIGFNIASYDKLVDWWVKKTQGKIDLYIGHGIYKLAKQQETGWHSADELIRQLEYNKKHTSISGSIFYSANNLLKNTKQVTDKLKSYYEKNK